MYSCTYDNVARVPQLCEVIWTTVDHSNYHNDGGYYSGASGPPAPPAMHAASLPLVQAIVPAIMSLRPRFSVALRRCNEDSAGAGVYG